MPVDPVRPRGRWLRRMAVVFAVGLLFNVVPLPAPRFVPVAFTESSFLPLERTVGAAELDAQQRAVGRELDDQRVTGAVEATDEFSMIGVSLDRRPDEPVLVRVRDADGAWGGWTELEVDADLGPEPGSVEAAGEVGAGSDDRVVTEPLWVDGATGYQVSTAGADADGLDVLTVHERTERVVRDATSDAGAAVPSPFQIRSRASWGARAPARTASVTDALHLAVVHHTATSNSYSSADVPGILRSMQAYHMDANGWSDLAYNFVVDRFGRIWEGRAGGTTRAVIGAHARGFNTGSVGVAVVGNYVETSASPEAREAVSRVVGYRLQQDGVDPTGRADVESLGSTTIAAGTVVNLPRVIGHRDVGATSCPGTLWSQLPTVRTRAADWAAWMDSLTSPKGAIDPVQVGTGRIDVTGWAVDPDVAEPARVHVVLAGRLVEDLADGYRPDLAARFEIDEQRGWGAGFDEVPPGEHRVCVTVIDQGAGRDKLLGCRTVVVK